jgi:mRNA-degrading endonuclease RelE of RelBE toxin-antitoxin system
MSLKIVRLETFDRDVKRLYKKYKQLSSDLRQLHLELSKNPKAGIDLGHYCYKIRVANSSVPTGKSGGFRVVYYYYDGEENLFLMTLFSKRDMETISDEKVVALLKKYHLA